MVSDERGKLPFRVGLVAGSAGFCRGLLLGGEYAVVGLRVDPLEFLLPPDLVVLHLLLEFAQVLLDVVPPLFFGLVRDVTDFLLLLEPESGVLLPLAVVGLPLGLLCLCLPPEFLLGVLLGLGVDLVCELAHVVCVPDEGQLIVALVLFLLPLFLLPLSGPVVVDLLQQLLLVLVLDLLPFLGSARFIDDGFGDALLGFFLRLLSAVAGVGDLLLQVLPQLFASLLVELSALLHLILVLFLLTLDILPILASIAPAFLLLPALVLLDLTHVVVVHLLELLLGEFDVAVLIVIKFAEGGLPALILLLPLAALVLLQTQLAVVAVHAHQTRLVGVSSLGSGLLLVPGLLGVAGGGQIFVVELGAVEL